MCLEDFQEAFVVYFQDSLPETRMLKVTCILPPIPHDPEDDVSMEDKHSDELETVKDISKKGYKFTADDWKNSQASASIEEESVNTKLNRIIEVMEENLKSMKDRMSLLEEENMQPKARVSELEGNQNVGPHTQTEVFPTNVTQQNDTQPSSGTLLSPMSQQNETQDFSPNVRQHAEESRLPTLFEIGADVEIASIVDTTCRIWYPAKVLNMNEVEKVTVEYYCTVFAEKRRVQNTITTDIIRHAPPFSDQKAFEMSDSVEVFYKNGWCSRQVKMVLGDNTEWIDGVWKIADEEKPSKKRKAAGSSQESGKDNVVPFLRRSERVPKRSRDTKTPFKSERNPALTVKRDIISAVDPFSTPADHKLQRLQNWLTSTGGLHEVTLLINKVVTRKSFFQYIENEGKDLRAVHIDGAFAMLNCRRN
ncbi:hypothetical protein Bca52824_021807 [Brassica carinata]|uniref:Agenet domain-containing protein n=1 Tax=Brassica carinata TaxID=52824 RepID=A0A8X7VF17_BRACI|nr:hypothetical protein Bca52824_021807 [Brassica carinata]